MALTTPRKADHGFHNFLPTYPQMLYAKFRSNRCRYSRKKEAKVFKSLRTTKDDVQIQIAKGLSDLDDEESPDLRPEPLMEGLYF